MIPAFILATFTFASLATFVIDHLLAFTSAGVIGLIVASVLLAIFLPAALPLIRTALDVAAKGLQWLIGTVAGRVIIAVVIAFLAGFWSNSFLDKSIELQKQLVAERAATAAAQAAASQARLEAASLNQVSAAAAHRAESAEAKSQDLQEQVSDYADQLAAAESAAPKAKPACRHALTAADIAALTRIGAPRAAKP